MLAVAFDGGGPRRRRIASLGIFAVAGTPATLLGNGTAASVWDSIAVIFGVTLVCGLAMAFGPRAGKMAFFVNLWTMLALSLSTALFAPIPMALGFFCGSASVQCCCCFPRKPIRRSQASLTRTRHRRMAPHPGASRRCAPT